jgi:hypothetical protein
MIRRSIALVALLGVTAPEPVTADEIRRRALPDFPISSSVEVPGGRTLVFLSGTMPDVADPDAAPGTIERFGDTAKQAAQAHRNAGGRPVYLGRARRITSSRRGTPSLPMAYLTGNGRSR